MKTRILLDANFLMVPAQFRLDIFEKIMEIMSEPYELVTIKPVMSELEKVASGAGKGAIAARVALELVRMRNVKIIRASGRADGAIIRLSEKNGIVCTQDRWLQRALKKKGVRILAMRKKSHLAFV